MSIGRQTLTAKARSRGATHSAAAALALVLLAPLPLAAHALAPALLVLQQRDGGIWEVAFKVPALLPRGENLRPLLPPWCTPVDDVAAARDGDALRLTWSVNCGERGLDGAPVGVGGLDRSRGAALLRVLYTDGGRARWLLTPAKSQVAVAPAGMDSLSSLAFRFALLGSEHLLSGLDHLAFLLGLFLLVRGRRRLLAAVSAFTVGHSITLSLAAFGCFPMSPPLVEVGIALSIVFVAAEIAAGGSGILARRPWAAALAFGLLHGAGFASALRLAGVPRQELPLALASFNAGIEVGQILFLALLLAIEAVLRRIPTPDAPGLRRLPAYGLGGVAAFWVLDRLAMLL